MAQEFHFPVEKVQSVEFRPLLQAWVIALEDDEVFLECSMIGADTKTFYVSCDKVLGDPPDYVEPME